MKNFLVLSLIFFCFSTIYCDIYQEESKKIEKDQKKIAEFEKKLATDDKGCENPSENMERNVANEVKIYCEARRSAKSRIPTLKKLLKEYEETLKNYLGKCSSVTNEESFTLCEDLNGKISLSSELLNDEKEKFYNEIDTLENAAARAAELNKINNEAYKEDFVRTISNNLNAKSELVNNMQKGLEKDKNLFQKSKANLNKSLAGNSEETKANGGRFLSGINNILLQNGNLLQICTSMLKTIKTAKELCIAKLNMEKCRETEIKLENLFADGNTKLVLYKKDKNDLISLEDEYYKSKMNEISVKMENAQKTIAQYLQNLKEQNSYLKQQIETSDKNLEVVKSRNNKKMTETYQKHIETMKELETESRNFIQFYEENTNKINNFTVSCVQGKSTFTVECKIEGDKIVSEINSSEKNIQKYGDKFNKLNKDLGDFYKKFK